MLRLISFYCSSNYSDRDGERLQERSAPWNAIQHAEPNFEGHHQPNVPADFGFYSQTDLDPLRRQAGTAARFGIHAFCHHVYWSGGERMLHNPLDLMLADPAIDLPFCICWANDGWLPSQEDGASFESVPRPRNVDTDNAFITAMASYIADPRYLRVAERPLILVRRPDLLADPCATTAHWRGVLVAKGLGDPYLVACDLSDIGDSALFGFDAVVQVPPHKALVSSNISVAPRRVRPGFAGRVFEYRKIRDWFLPRGGDGARVFKGVMPSWDDTAQRQDSSNIVHGATVAAFEQWLLTVARQTVLTKPPQERLVFINAWNAWGKGCYLEPDERHGYGRLEAVKRVVDECEVLANTLDLHAANLDAATRAKIAAVIASYERSLSAYRFLESHNAAHALEAMTTSGFLDTAHGAILQRFILGAHAAQIPTAEFRAAIGANVRAVDLVKILAGKMWRRVLALAGRPAP